jgi:septum site-determining protein MinC
MGSFTTYEINNMDLSFVSSVSELISELSKKIDDDNFYNKKIRLNLGDIALNNSQILSIKSLIESIDSEIAVIFTNSTQTQLSALNAGILVSDQIDYEKREEPVEQVTEVNMGETLIIEPEQEDELINTENNLMQDIQDNVSINISHKNIQNQTLYIKQTLRSGQSISFDGNIVIIGDCHAGSELIAAGDITVWGILGGIAHAGAKGDENACIRALKINAIQLRIAGYFARRPDRTEVEIVHKSAEFTPEEARIYNQEIVIYTLNE